MIGLMGSFKDIIFASRQGPALILKEFLKSKKEDTGREVSG